MQWFPLPLALLKVHSPTCLLAQGFPCQRPHRRSRMTPEGSQQQQTSQPTISGRGCLLSSTHSHRSSQLAHSITNSHQGKLCPPNLSCSRRDVYHRAGQNQTLGMRSNHHPYTLHEACALGGCLGDVVTLEGSETTEPQTRLPLSPSRNQVLIATFTAQEFSSTTEVQQPQILA